MSEFDTSADFIDIDSMCQRKREIECVTPNMLRIFSNEYVQFSTNNENKHKTKIEKIQIE